VGSQFCHIYKLLFPAPKSLMYFHAAHSLPICLPCLHLDGKVRYSTAYKTCSGHFYNQKQSE